MARKVSNEDIIKMNELYLEHKTYAAVSRIVGFSPSTVKKYIQPDYVAAGSKEITHFDKKLVDLEINSDEVKDMVNIFKQRNWNLLSVLSTEEEKEIEELWKEMYI